MDSSVDLMILFWLFLICYLAFYLYGRYYFFRKIGEDGWKGLIPIYSEALYFKKARVNPVIAVGLILMYFVFLFLTISFAGLKELVGTCIFIQIVCFVFFMFYYLKASHYISEKFKRGSFTTLGLTFLPFIMIPVMGLSNKYRWHRFVKVDIGVWDEDFYSRKITVGEMCFTNIFMILCVLVEIYIFAYIFILGIPKEILFDIIWEPSFIVFFSVIFIFIAVVGTLLVYYGNVCLRKYRRK